MLLLILINLSDQIKVFFFLKQWIKKMTLSFFIYKMMAKYLKISNFNDAGAVTVIKIPLVTEFFLNEV